MNNWDQHWKQCPENAGYEIRDVYQVVLSEVVTIRKGKKKPSFGIRYQMQYGNGEQVYKVNYHQVDDFRRKFVTGELVVGALHRITLRRRKCDIRKVNVWYKIACLSRKPDQVPVRSKKDQFLEAFCGFD